MMYVDMLIHIMTQGGWIMLIQTKRRGQIVLVPGLHASNVHAELYQSLNFQHF